MDLPQLREYIVQAWDTSVLERLEAYIRIPNKSPHFDPDWQAHGHMEAAVQLMAQWAKEQPIAGLRVEVRRIPGRTPLLLIEVPGEAPGTVLLYGHLDKQPEFTGWADGSGPWEPVLRNGKLYGRGGADDGYAVFSALTEGWGQDAHREPTSGTEVVQVGARGPGIPKVSRAHRARH